MYRKLWNYVYNWKETNLLERALGSSNRLRLILKETQSSLQNPYPRIFLENPVRILPSA